MPENDNTKKSLLDNAKENPIGAIVLVIALAASVRALFKFLDTTSETGWVAASNATPFGKIVFLIVLGIGYFILAGWLKSKEGVYKELSRIMLWIGAFVLIAAASSLLPSCESDNRLNSQGELPYYRK